MRVLVTRPEKEGRATVARLTALGHVGVLEPLTTIVANRDAAVPDEPFQAVTATSLNAVEGLAGDARFDRLRGLPFFAVGDRTAAAARAAGFAEVRSAAGDRRALAAAIRVGLDPAAGPLLWLVGRDRAGDLVADLASDGFRVVPLEVYRAEPVAALRATTQAALAAGEIDAVLVFSPRSGSILLDRLADCGFSPGSPGLAVRAISEAAARPFREAGWVDVGVAASPDTEAMLATLGPAPPSADIVGRETRSSPMSPQSRKTPRSATEAEADTTAAGPTAEAVDATVEAGDAAPETVSATAEPSPEPGREPIESATVEPAAEPAVAPEPASEPTPAAAPPTAAPKPSEPPPPVAAKGGGFGIGGVLVAALLGGALGTAGGYGLAFQGLLPTGAGEAGRVAALETTVAALQARKPVAAVDPAIADRLAALEKRASEPAAPQGAAAPVDLAALEGRLAKLEAAALPPAVDLSGIESRLTRLETAPKPTVDLSGLEERLTKLETAPPVAVPPDLAERLAALEAAAKARADAAQNSVAGAFSAIPAEGASKATLADAAGQIDRTIGALRETLEGEIAALKARVDQLGGSLDAESKATIERVRAESKALATRLTSEANQLAERLGALSTTTLEDLRKRNDDFARGLSDRVKALVGANDAEAKKRLDEAARAISEKLAATAPASEAELKAREAAVSAEIDKLRGELAATAGRVGALETAGRDAGAVGDKLVAKVDEAAAAAESRVGALESRLTGLRTEAEAARQAQKGAVALMALADLKVAVEAGRPYGAELTAVEAVAGGLVDLAALKPQAAAGVPTLATLRERWPAAARALLAAADKAPGGEGVFERLLSHAVSVVKVRPTGDTGGDDPAARAGRIEAALKAGDAAAALGVWKSLPEPARAASAEWGKALEARVGVDAALAAQTTALVSRLTQKPQ